ncbi:MAG: hypothetical protein IKD10_04670 [Lentisphaeria bacterium]|nr:hypothetical protein [Lentisphaerota bacterium]MBR7144216.1 hypothetical protein [Lentisphaeria bacterium]
MKKFVLLVSLLSVGFGAMGFPGLSAPTNALIAAKNRGGQQDSINNMRQIFSGITMYTAANNDMLPADFSALASYVGGGRIFVAAFDKKSKPASGNEIKPGNTSFAYVGNLGRIDALKNAAATPIAFEKPWLLPPSQRAVVVLFADGHVERIQLPASTPKSCRGVIALLNKKLSDKNLKNKLNKNAAAEDKAKK